MSADITMGKQLDNKAVATAVDWPVRFVLKATEAELKGKAKVNLKTDSCSCEIEARECEWFICITILVICSNWIGFVVNYFLVYLSICELTI